MEVVAREEFARWEAVVLIPIPEVRACERHQTIESFVA